MKRVRQRFDQIYNNPFHEDLDDLVYYAIKGECSRDYLKSFIKEEVVNITPDDLSETYKVLTGFTKEFYTQSSGYTNTVIELYKIPDFKLPVFSLYQKFPGEFSSPGFVWNMALKGNGNILNDLLAYGRVNPEELLKHYKGYQFNPKMVKIILERRPDLIDDSILRSLMQYLDEDDVRLYEFLKPKMCADTIIKCLLMPLKRDKIVYMMYDWLDPDCNPTPVEPFEYYPEIPEEGEEYEYRFGMFKDLILDEKVDRGYVLKFLVKNDLPRMFSHFREVFPDFAYDREKMLHKANKRECERVIKLI